MIPVDIEITEIVSKFSSLSGVKLITELKKAFPGQYRMIAEQIALRPKAESKLPAMVKAGCLFTAKSLEQSSSLPLAEFKASKFMGNTLLDLTGGLGVDDIAFGRSFGKVTSLDNDTGLNEIVKYNLSRLRIKNIERLDADAYEFLASAGHYNMIYVDSDRRTKRNNARSITLHDAEPSILKIKHQLLRAADKVLLKLSPLIDLTYLIRTLPETKHIMVISLKGEVKELLAVLETGKAIPPSIHAIDIRNDGHIVEYSGRFKEKHEPAIKSGGIYFVDPSASLVKAGLTESYANKNKLFMASGKSVYMVCNKLPESVFGRAFEIVNFSVFSKAGIKSYLHSAGIKKANISSRNFGVRNEVLKKAFELSDGGNDYLFFVAGKNEKLMYHCRKLQ